jgi:hypothetical protein
MRLPLDHHAGQGAGDAVHHPECGRRSAGLADPDRGLNPGDDVIGAGEILGQLDTISVAERRATWATLVPMST